MRVFSGFYLVLRGSRGGPILKASRGCKGVPWDPRRDPLSYQPCVTPCMMNLKFTGLTQNLGQLY
jgi:hypothetical protein